MKKSAKKLTPEEQKNADNETMFHRLLQTSAGREKLAASLGPSLRRRRDYMSSARKALTPQPEAVVQGMTLYYVSSTGGDIVCRQAENKNEKSFQVPTFEINSNPMIPVKMIQQGQVNLVARSLNIAKAEIGHVEDAYMFSLFDAAASGANRGRDGNPDVAFDQDDVSFDGDLNFLKKVRKNFKKNGVKDITHLFANPKDCVPFLTNFGFVPNGDAKQWKTGLLGYLEGIAIYQSRTVPQGFMYITGQTDTKKKRVVPGVIVDDAPLRVKTADRLDLRQIGFNISEKVGFAVNPVAVQRVKISR